MKNELFKELHQNSSFIDRNLLFLRYLANL